MGIGLVENDNGNIDEKAGGSPGASVSHRSKIPPRRVTTVHGINRPFFHVDVAAAVENAISNAETKLENRGSTETLKA